MTQRILSLLDGNHSWNSYDYRFLTGMLELVKRNLRLSVRQYDYLQKLEARVPKCALADELTAQAHETHANVLTRIKELEEAYSFHVMRIQNDSMPTPETLRNMADWAEQITVLRSCL